MEPNPYQSPQPGDASAEKSPASADPVIQLLTEIRDMQRETLQLSRETIQRQQKYRVFPLIMMIVAMGFLGFSMYRMIMIPRPAFPTPARRASSPAPLPVTASPPVTDPSTTR